MRFLGTEWLFFSAFFAALAQEETLKIKAAKQR